MTNSIGIIETGSLALTAEILHRLLSYGKIELLNLDGTNGFKVDGETAGDCSGISVSTVGDINADGISDVIIGAPNADLSSKINTGRCYVLFGHNSTWASSIELSNLDGTNGYLT